MDILAQVTRKFILRGRYGSYIIKYCVDSPSMPADNIPWPQVMAKAIHIHRVKMSPLRLMQLSVGKVIMTIGNAQIHLK